MRFVRVGTLDDPDSFSPDIHIFTSSKQPWVVNGTIWNLALAWSAARITGRLAPNVAFKTWFNRCVGAVFIGVGLRLALSHDR